MDAEPQEPALPEGPPTPLSVRALPAELRELPAEASAPSAASPTSPASGDGAAPASPPPAPPERPAERAVPAARDIEASDDADLMAELLLRYRRLQEESDRVEVEAKTQVVRELLEVLDELERADAEMAEDSVAGRAIFAAARKFEDKLQALGMSRVQALGRPFDEVLHRAVGGCPGADRASQVVIEELESGWTLGEEVVRPALVTLG